LRRDKKGKEPTFNEEKSFGQGEWGEVSMGGKKRKTLLRKGKRSSYPGEVGKPEKKRKMLFLT